MLCTGQAQWHLSCDYLQHHGTYGMYTTVCKNRQRGPAACLSLVGYSGGKPLGSLVLIPGRWHPVMVVVIGKEEDVLLSEHNIFPEFPREVV